MPTGYNVAISDISTESMIVGQSLPQPAVDGTLELELTVYGSDADEGIVQSCSYRTATHSTLYS